MLTKKKILREIGNPNLDLCKGEGYCYFVYDDGDRFETHSVPVVNYNTLPFDSWVSEGKDFLQNIADNPVAETSSKIKVK